MPFDVMHGRIRAPPTTFIFINFVSQFVKEIDRPYSDFSAKYICKI